MPESVVAGIHADVVLELNVLHLSGNRKLTVSHMDVILSSRDHKAVLMVTHFLQDHIHSKKPYLLILSILMKLWEPITLKVSHST